MQGRVENKLLYNLFQFRNKNIIVFFLDTPVFWFQQSPLGRAFKNTTKNRGIFLYRRREFELTLTIIYIYAIIVSGYFPLAEVIIMKCGSYLGFSPTDESAVMCGEVEIVINETHLTWRHAGGLYIDEDTVPLTDFREMTRGEITNEFKDGTSSADKVVAGYTRVDGDGGPKLLFFDTASLEKGEFELIVVFPVISAIFGPTLLFGPEQVARGEFDEAIKAIEEQTGVGVVPRLRNNGRSEN